jgi:serine/threonine-protein kinase RsbW
MAEHVVRLSFPAKPDYLLLARLALSGVTRDLTLDDELLADLKLAVTEACGNAVRHAYPDGGGNVTVSYVVANGALEMVVEDQGAGLSARLAEEPTTPLPETGMGMSIMRTIVDELDVRVGDGGRGTVVRMVKRLES